MDRTFLNKEISSFEKVVPTAENIAVRIGQLLRSPVRELGAELHKIKLIESPNNSCEIYGADLEEVAAQRQQPEAILAKV
ncbi:6-pyruvoyl trahydropterin synthase family protein [Microcoleus sp. Pol11C3]|uniref:6-pyruvoyl trahydropterin synthase family protein n=1 Tax=Microcoleus sp. Pol11C3 TaxID=3055390 RepID=UPI0040406FB7